MSLHKFFNLTGTFTIATLTMLPALLTLLPTFFSSEPASATTGTNPTYVNLAVTDATKTITPSASASIFATTSSNVALTTDGTYGYTLTMQADSNSLVHSTNPSKTIPLYYNTTNPTSTTKTNYTRIPTTDIELADSDTGSELAKTIGYGLDITRNQTQGQYETEIVYTATAKENLVTNLLPENLTSASPIPSNLITNYNTSAGRYQAFDGNDTTQTELYSTENHSGGYFGWQFNGTKHVVGVYAALGAPGKTYNFSLQYLNNSTWTTFYSGTLPGYTSYNVNSSYSVFNLENLDFNATAIRIYSDTYKTQGNNIYIHTLQAYGY